jgi:glycosyltransferase involved in cell wall biosynthesis
MNRICMITFSYYPEDIRICREAEALIEKGDMVDVICLKKREESTNEVKNGVKIFRLSTGRYRGSNKGIYLLKYLQFFIAATIQLLVLHLKKHYHIIQIHTMPDFLVFTAIIPKLMGSKIILDVHDLVPELYQTKFGLENSHWLIRFFTWVERNSIRFADRAISVSKPHLNVLIRHGNPEGKFIIFLNLPNPKFSLNRSKVPLRDHRGFRIVYHGTVSRRYGLDIVIQSLASIKDEVEGLEFQIIGQGEELPHISKLVNDLGMHDCVTIHEWMPPEEFIPIILDADIGIVPILDDDFTKHALPVKLLEYVALGKPVICSRTAAIQAYFDDSMLQYFTAGSVAELTENICLLYKNPDKREQLVKNADEFNQEYSWERQKQAYFQMMDELIEPNSAAHHKVKVF